MSNELNEAVESLRELAERMRAQPRQKSAIMSTVLDVCYSVMLETLKLVLETFRNVAVIVALVIVAYKSKLPWIFELAAWIWLALLLYVGLTLIILVERVIKIGMGENGLFEGRWKYEDLFVVRLALFAIIIIFVAKFVNYRLADVFQAALSSNFGK